MVGRKRKREGDKEEGRGAQWVGGDLRNQLKNRGGGGNPPGGVQGTPGGPGQHLFQPVFHGAFHGTINFSINK